MLGHISNSLSGICMRQPQSQYRILPSALKDIQLSQRQNAAVLESLTQSSAIQLAALTGIADRLSSLAARTDALQNAAIQVTTSAIPRPSERAQVVRAARKKLPRPPKLVGPFSIGEAR
jgi:hypothetical protein